MKILIQSILIIFLLIACSDNSSNTNQSLITGRWEGEATYQVSIKLGLKLNLSESNGNVSGNGTFYVSVAGIPQETNVTVSGTFKNPTLNLVFSGITGLTYNGNLSATNNKMIIGTINTMEYPAQNLTLSKVN
jgi:hypothetical protein